MLLHRREDAKATLHSSSIVVGNVAFYRLHKLLFASETPSVIPLTFQDAPEAFHRPVVYTMRHAGHALRHARLFELVVKGSVRVLEASVAME